MAKCRKKAVKCYNSFDTNFTELTNFDPEILKVFTLCTLNFLCVFSTKTGDIWKSPQNNTSQLKLSQVHITDTGVTSLTRCNFLPLKSVFLAFKTWPSLRKKECSENFCKF